MWLIMWAYMFIRVGSGFEKPESPARPEAILKSPARPEARFSEFKKARPGPRPDFHDLKKPGPARGPTFMV